MAEATTWGSDPEFFGPRHLARLALIERLLAPAMRPGARALDVGSGAGRLVATLASRGLVATGIEPAEPFVAYARGRAPAGATYMVGEAAPLPFADASFEVATAGEVLEHLDDDAAAARELWRVLTPGGLCVVTVPADPAAWDPSDDWAGHRRRYAPEALAALFTAAGFERVTVRRWGWPVGRLYHQAVYLPMLARKQARGDAPSRPAGPMRRLATAVLRAALALDTPFLGAPGGLSLVLTAYKP